MNVFEFFNTAIGSTLAIVLIAADYIRKYNTDRFQRKLFLILLCSMFFATICDYLGLTLEKNPSEKLNIIIKYIWSLFFIGRNCSVYFIAVFLDYFAHGSKTRTTNLIKIILCFLFIYILSLFPNINMGYYFYLSRENLYMPGTLYMLQIIISYFPTVIILINLGLASKNIKKIHVFLTFTFVVLSALGAALDIILKTTNMIWPCITTSVLYIYFFLIRSDSKIDSLTGIGNRSSFNEYLSNLSSQAETSEHTFILIDLDDFREINSKYGHLEGDNALRDISSIIKSCTRNTDFAARLGSDEFILVTEGAGDVQNIIKRIEHSIETQNMKKIRPYRLNFSYSYDIYKNDSGWTLREFLAQLENDITKTKESRIGENNV